MSDSSRPHDARPPCPSPTPGVYPNSCPLSWWCHLTIELWYKEPVWGLLVFHILRTRSVRFVHFFSFLSFHFSIPYFQFLAPSSDFFRSFIYLRWIYWDSTMCCGALWARILEWVAISISRGFSQIRGQNCIPWILYHWAANSSW